MELIFTHKRTEIGNAASYFFRWDSPLSWLAGQSLRLEIMGDYGPIEHRFTIASAPFEGRVMITTRLSDSEYKRRLASLQPGDKAKGYAVEGDFAWPAGNKPPVFVAAGIGITPFRSLLLQRAHQGLPLNATLIYGSSRSFVFAGELNRLAAEHPTLTIHFIPRRLKPTDIPKTKAKIYIAGPSLMIEDLQNQLLKNGYSKEQIKLDGFTGNQLHL